MHALNEALAGKHVMVVGGVGEGIGGAISRAVAQTGAAGLAIVGRRLEKCEGLAGEIKSPTCNAFGLAADVLKPDEADALVGRAVERLGGLDVLITVVGGATAYAPYKPLEETLDDEWHIIVDANLTYVFRLLRRALPVFVAQGEGSIVSIGSIAAVQGMATGPAYGAAKAGLMSLAQSVGAGYGRRGIRMNVINCGFIATPSTARLIAEGGGLGTGSIPAGRPGTPEEIADLTVYLASPFSAYVNGQSWNVDGGVTARGRVRVPHTDPSMACHC